MIKDKLPQDLNFVPPTDVIIEAIEDLEGSIRKQNTWLMEMDKDIAKLKGQVEKLQKELKLIKKYTE
jgi:uncharacterized coiled-coil protein SlyX